MKKQYFILLLLYIITHTVFGQVADSFKIILIDTLTNQLPEIDVTAYFKAQPLLTSPASISIIDSNQLSTHPNNNLIGAINSVPGARMEERSPESFRLSIRGSVLRSPFGIRNIKIYVAGMCLTDAGGNTYLNVFDPASISSLEILKGPEGSIYGANSGGVVIINPVLHPTDSFVVNAMGEGGSFGYAQGKLFLQRIWKKYLLNVSLSYKRADGYRQNSGSQAWTAQIFQQWQYAKKAKLQAFILFTNLKYQTPGGLTLAQFEADPRLARPATKTLRGAAEQKAAIYNNTIFAGLNNEVTLRKNLVYTTIISGSYTDFKNPFITNYEKRKETNIGLRTYMQWSGGELRPVKWNWVNGLEVQQILSSIYDYGNNYGKPDTIQTAYNFNGGDCFAFSRFAMNIINRITIEGAASINYNWYQYRPVPSAGQYYNNISFKPQVMPRLAISVKIISDLAWRASVSRGYSAPTLAEVHPSANLISQKLQPESGWCYETGFRFRQRHGYVWLDIATFYYRLQNAISSRSDSAGNDYFINAGGTNQIGLEGQLIIWIIRPRTNGFVRSLQINGAYTYSHFTFRNYYTDVNNYSGHMLTGVPPHTIVSSIAIHIKLWFFLFIEHNHTSSLPLNDANTKFAKYYNLLQCKVGWGHAFRHLQLEVFAGANNLLNKTYSLGNDLNAVGGRYYNAAAPRNYYAGMSIGFR